MRAYLEGGEPSADQPDLLVDHAAAREQLSFITLLVEPQRFDQMRAAFESYRATYARAYEKHHERHWRVASTRHAAIEEAAPAARALERLNTLSALGRPTGRAALGEFDRLRRARAACDGAELPEELRRHPVCPSCGLGLADRAPQDEVERTVRRVHAALARQQARLASEAVRRILARGGERLEQFINIVQASDQAGLTRILDEELLLFLRDLLEQPAGPSAQALELIGALARAHPAVCDGDIDAAAETLRRLLSERLRARGGHPIELGAPAT